MRRKRIPRPNRPLRREPAIGSIQTYRLESISYRPYVVYPLLAFVVWVIATWIVTSGFIEWRANRAYENAKATIEQSVSDVHVGLERNLGVLHSFPAAIGRDLLIKKAIHEIHGKSLPRSMSREDYLAAIANKKSIKTINKSLADTVKEMGAMSVIWVIDSTGKAIAASNYSLSESFIGTDYSDREYFKEAMAGNFGRQFALGRRTNIPGLFFSAPVIEGTEAIGVVAGKVDLTFLSYWVNQANAFITDSNGVIIQAQDRTLEMKLVPGATVHTLPSEALVAKYRRDKFEQLNIDNWQSDRFSDLLRVNGRGQPYLMATKTLSGEQLNVSILQEVPYVGNTSRDFILFFTLISFVGGLLIAGITNFVFHRQSIVVSKRNRAHQELIEHLASHDSLTGLYSRAVVDQLMTQGIAYSRSSESIFAVLFVDLDLFKEVNDTMGHEAGDEVLKEFARRLKESVRSADAVIRYGGDEFIILLNGINHEKDAGIVAEKILGTVKMPFLINGASIKLSSSIGISFYPNHGDTPSMLLKRADIALYRAKDGGRDNYCIYSAQMDEDALATKEMEADLQIAMEKKQFLLNYQPKFSFEKNRITGCEALVRWVHPEKGFISPAEFIPVSERTGMIVELGEWIIHEACAQAAQWRKDCGYDISVAVNVSAIQFKKKGLFEVVENALRNADLPPHCLELELTESIMMNDSIDTIRTVERFKELGVSIAIDDFGTGHSNMAYIQDFSVDVLKIDQRFVKDMAIKPKNQTIVLAMISMAKSLGYKVVAEGVESEQESHILHGMGCHMIQGYWLAKPMPKEAITKFMLDHHEKTTSQPPERKPRIKLVNTKAA